MLVPIPSRIIREERPRVKEKGCSIGPLLECTSAQREVRRTLAGTRDIPFQTTHNPECRNQKSELQTRGLGAFPPDGGSWPEKEEKPRGWHHAFCIGQCPDQKREEAASGFAPELDGFADRRLATWLSRQ